MKDPTSKPRPPSLRPEPEPEPTPASLVFANSILAALIMAAAAVFTFLLLRLGPCDAPESELPPPDGIGAEGLPE